MSDNIRELEIQLENAKKSQKEAEKLKNLDNNSKFIGKCYSTHLFQRVPKVNKKIYLRKVTDVIYEQDELYFVGTTITFQLTKSNDFKISISEEKCSQPYPYWISSLCHEISADLFDRILVETQAHAETYFDMVRGLFKQNELISSGDKMREENKLKWLNEEKFIELPSEGFPSVKDILAWNNHPYLYDHNKLIHNKSSIEIVKKIADDIEKNMHSWGEAIYIRDKERVDVLRSFYKKYKM